MRAAQKLKRMLSKPGAHKEGDQDARVTDEGPAEEPRADATATTASHPASPASHPLALASSEDQQQEAQDPVWPPQDWLSRTPTAKALAGRNVPMPTPELSFSSDRTTSDSQVDHTSDPASTEIVDEPEEMDANEQAKVTATTSPPPAVDTDSPAPAADQDNSTGSGDTAVILADEPEEMNSDEELPFVLRTRSERARDALPLLNIPAPPSREEMEATEVEMANSPEQCASPDAIVETPVASTSQPAKQKTRPAHLNLPRSFTGNSTTGSFGFPRPPMHPNRSGGPVKETLHAQASLTPDGTRMVNQYIMLERIGRGSFGTVVACIDAETGDHYAAKELSRSRLRRKAKRDQARTMRRKQQQRTLSGDLQLDPEPSTADNVLDTEIDPLYLVRNEIAIMKKVSHPNVVRLVEVLDVSSEDTIYLILELCEGGPIMDLQISSPTASRKNNVTGKATGPLPPDKAWDWFRQVVLGVAYLHANEIIHHDIKPDNIRASVDNIDILTPTVLTDDRQTCKIVDFGVSAVFEKPGDDTGGGSVASPAFASPEQIAAARLPDGVQPAVNVHGRASDIWAMGITLFCMLTGHLPWQHVQVLDMYKAIETEEYVMNVGRADAHSVPFPDNIDADAVDLVRRMLDKDPATRIKMSEICEHPWLTAHGELPLPSPTASGQRISEVTQADLDDAYHTAWSSIRRTFHDAASIARSRAYEASGGSQAVGAGFRRAFWKQFRRELAARGSESLDRRWNAFWTGKSSAGSTSPPSRPTSSHSHSHSHSHRPSTSGSAFSSFTASRRKSSSAVPDVK